MNDNRVQNAKALITAIVQRDECLIPSGHEDAVIGIAIAGDRVVAVLDVDVMLDRWVAEGMTPDEAEEWFSNNVEGAWMGKGTPVYVRDGWKHARNRECPHVRRRSRETGRCITEFTCVDCGKIWEVDSSD